MTTQANSQLISLEQAAGLLAVSLRTVDRMVKRGELPVVRVGRLRRIRSHDLETLAAGDAITNPLEYEARPSTSHQNDEASALHGGSSDHERPTHAPSQTIPE